MSLKAKAKRWIYGAAGNFPYYGKRVYFPGGSHIFQRACEEGIYEKESVRAIAALARPESFYFDVGANIGLLALPILSYYPTCKVVSFEPSPNTLPYLERTARESGYGERWRILGKATGDRAGTAEFFKHAPGQGAYDSLKSTGRGGVASSVAVPVTTLDAEWESLGKPDVSVIKMDVEGAEFQAILGGRECIRQCRPSLFLEWNAENLAAFGTRPGALIELACELDCEIYSSPRMLPVPGAAALELQMLNGDGFLLAPRTPPEKWRVNFEGFRGLR